MLSYRLTNPLVSIIIISRSNDAYIVCTQMCFMTALQVLHVLTRLIVLRRRGDRMMMMRADVNRAQPIFRPDLLFL